MRGATGHYDEKGRVVLISIHAPHAGRDFEEKRDYITSVISIHAPHAGRDDERS